MIKISGKNKGTHQNTSKYARKKKKVMLVLRNKNREIIVALKGKFHTIENYFRK